MFKRQRSLKRSKTFKEVEKNEKPGDGERSQNESNNEQAEMSQSKTSLLDLSGKEIPAEMLQSAKPSPGHLKKGKVL